MDTVIICVCLLIIVIKDIRQHIAQGELMLFVQLITGSNSSPDLVYAHMVTCRDAVDSLGRNKGRELPMLLINLQLQTATKHLISLGFYDFILVIIAPLA